MGGINNNETINTEIGNNLKRKNLFDKMSEGVRQVKGATSDMIRNYTDMKKDKTIKGDDYFHCKANYEASKRGGVGEKNAEYFGNIKEEFDYFKNRGRGISAVDVYADYLHDKDVNRQGRQLSKNELYKNSREACHYQRVRGINEKY